MKTLKTTLFMFALAGSTLSMTALAGGTIQFAAGTVTISNPRGEARPAAKGSTFAQGDTISTRSGSRAQLRFTDGALVSLQPDTDFRVDAYRFEGRPDGKEKGFFNLLKGGMRTITGLIGRHNRDAYRVDTPVATIGIRGTEYTAQLDAGNENLLIHTGEGLVEICNAAGCILLASGETGRVSSQQEPKRTETRPQLPPPPHTEVASPTFSVSENRSESGGILPLGPTLPSGSGYSIAIAGPDISNGSGASIHPDQYAEFSGGELVYRSDSTPSWSRMQQSAGAISADGVLSWGRWILSEDFSDLGLTTIKNTHYVIGQPTPSADLMSLSGKTLMYQMIGFTLPTSADGTAGGISSGSLKLTFAGGYSISSQLNLNASFAGNTYALSGSGYSYGTSFSGSGASGLSYSGFAAGSMASHAGVSYTFDANGTPVYGTAAFKNAP